MPDAPRKTLAKKTLAKKTLADLIAVMAALRTPVTGCPWDLEQNFASIAPYTIEEAYEVADAIERGDLVDLQEELGDLLLQVVYHARLAEEQGAFDFGDVADGVTTKMLRRHPHVFDDETARTAGMAKGAWDRIKAEEKAAKATARAAKGVVAREAPSLLDDVPRGMTALTRAIKLQDKAAKVGFDWPSLGPVLAKVKEEIAELEEALLGEGGTTTSGSDTPAEPSVSPSPSWGGARGGGRAAESEQVVHPTPNPSPSRGGEQVEEEFGDLLFVLANVARHLQIDPEAALRAANAKFTRRFRHIEARLAEQGRSPSQSTLDEMDALWNEAKRGEKAPDR